MSTERELALDRLTAEVKRIIGNYERDYEDEICEVRPLHIYEGVHGKARLIGVEVIAKRIGRA